MMLFVVQFVSVQQVHAGPVRNLWNKVVNYFKPKKESKKIDAITRADMTSEQAKELAKQKDPFVNDETNNSLPTNNSDTNGLADPKSVAAGSDAATSGVNNSNVYADAKVDYPDLAPWFAPYKFHKNTQKERKESGEGFFMNKTDGLHEIDGSQYSAKSLVVVTEKGDFDLDVYDLEQSNMIPRSKSKEDKVVMRYREGVMDFVTQRVYFTGRYIEYKPSVSVKIQKGKRGEKGEEVKRLSTYNKLNLRVSTGQTIPGQNFLFGPDVEPTLQSAQDISNHVNIVTGESLKDAMGKQAEVLTGEQGEEKNEAEKNKEKTDEKKDTEAPDEGNLIIIQWMPDGGENMPTPKKKLRKSQKPATGDGTPEGSKAAEENKSTELASKDVPEAAAKMGIKHSAEYIKQHGEKREVTFTCYGDPTTAMGVPVTPFRTLAVSSGQYKGQPKGPKSEWGDIEKKYKEELADVNKKIEKGVEEGYKNLTDKQKKAKREAVWGKYYESWAGTEVYIEGLSNDYPEADGLTRVEDFGGALTETKWDLGVGADEKFCAEGGGWKGNKKYTVYFLRPYQFSQEQKTETKTSYLNNPQARKYIANVTKENTYLSAYEKAYDTMTSIFLDEVLAETNKKEEEKTEEKTPDDKQKVDESRADPDGDNANGLNPGQGMGSFVRKEADAPLGIYIIRNNSTVRKDRALIGWLQAGAGQARGAYPRELLSIILEMREEIKQLSFEETYRMQQIKEELEREKDNIWYDATTMISVMLGYLLITYAILVVVIYWFDVFNVYTRGSVMMVISFGKWYPVSDKANLHISKNQTNPKYVDFKDILIRAGIIIVIAVMFIRITPIISFIVNIKNEIAVRLGGLG